LAEEFLNPLGVTQYRLAERIRVPRRRINEIVLGQRSVSADTALSLARFFGTSDRFWLNLQATYDLELERDRIGADLDTGQYRDSKTGIVKRQAAENLGPGWCPRRRP
jgi:addiction module HigA family antidote